MKYKFSVSAALQLQRISTCLPTSAHPVLGRCSTYLYRFRSPKSWGRPRLLEPDDAADVTICCTQSEACQPPSGTCGHIGGPKMLGRFCQCPQLSTNLILQPPRKLWLNFTRVIPHPPGCHVTCSGQLIYWRRRPRKQVEASGFSACHSPKPNACYQILPASWPNFQRICFCNARLLRTCKT